MKYLKCLLAVVVAVFFIGSNVWAISLYDIFVQDPVIHQNVNDIDDLQGDVGNNTQAINNNYALDSIQQFQISNNAFINWIQQGQINHLSFENWIQWSAINSNYAFDYYQHGRIINNADRIEEVNDFQSVWNEEQDEQIYALNDWNSTQDRQINKLDKRVGKLEDRVDNLEDVQYNIGVGVRTYIGEMELLGYGKYNFSGQHHEIGVMGIFTFGDSPQDKKIKVLQAQLNSLFGIPEDQKIKKISIKTTKKSETKVIPTIGDGNGGFVVKKEY